MLPTTPTASESTSTTGVPKAYALPPYSTRCGDASLIRTRTVAPAKLGLPAAPPGPCPRGLDHAQHPFSYARCNRPQSSGEMGQEACGIVIPFVQRQPGNRSRLGYDPFAE